MVLIDDVDEEDKLIKLYGLFSFNKYIKLYLLWIDLSKTILSNEQYNI